VIVATRGRPVLFNITNQLPPHELIPVDPTLMASATQTVGQLPLNRIVTHVHGGFTPWFSDGTPFQWFTPDGLHGESFMNVPGTNPPPGTATHYYPMEQSARLLWYHDHAMGITRTNAYVGIASALVLTDAFEAFLVSQGLVPDLVGIPLIIQDKTFVPANILAVDPTWRWGMPGDLWSPHLYEFNSGPFGICADNPKGRWDYGPCVAQPAVLPPGNHTLPNPSVVPEFFADTAIVNGAPYPVVNVTDKTFRFRLLNGSQARMWHLNLYKESFISGEPDTTRPGPQPDWDRGRLLARGRRTPQRHSLPARSGRGSHWEHRHSGRPIQPTARSRRAGRPADRLHRDRRDVVHPVQRRSGSVPGR